jgi:hypothetical protein
MGGYVIDITKQIREVSTSMESVRLAVGEELMEAQNTIGAELKAVKAQISADMRT